jgi:hypothetical protein
MSHLNFSIRAAEARRKPFNPRARISPRASSVVWMVFAVMAVAGATFVIVWFA